MAKKFSAQYTAGDILALYERKKSDGGEGRLRSTATLLRSMCRMEHQVTIPKQYEAITKQVRTPYLRDAWLRITGSLVAKAPVCQITPKDMKNEKYRDAANIAERFDSAMIERFSKELGRDIIAINTANHVRDGESVMKVVHRPQAWARFPKRGSESAEEYNDRVSDFKRGIDLPISWLDVDRLSVLAEDGDYGDNWVMEYGEYEKPMLKAKYRMASNENGKLVNPDSVLEGRGMPEGLQPTSGERSVKLEFWTDEEWHVIIDGSEAPGYPKPNPYSPYLPYFRAPALEKESLLYSLLYLVPQLDSLLTMKMNWAFLGAYPNPVLETVPNSNVLPEIGFGDSGPIALNSPQQATVWEPGKLMELPLGRRLSFLTPPPVGQDINDLIIIMKNLIDVAGVPSVMRGSAGAGDAGYLYNQMMAAAQMMYRQSVLSLQRQMERATEFSHWLIENKVRQTVYVLGWNKIKNGKPDIKEGNAWIGLSPESGSKDVAEIKKLGPISFKYRPTLPTDEQARAMIAMQLTNAAVPLSSVRHAIEDYLQADDPEAIMDEIWLDKAMATPQITDLMIKKALEENGLIPVEQPPNPLENPNPFGGGLVDQYGQPMGGPMGAVPGAEQMVTGTPAVPGVTMPVQPVPPVGPGVIGAPGGRPAGGYPGQPGGPNL